MSDTLLKIIAGVFIFTLFLMVITPDSTENENTIDIGRQEYKLLSIQKGSYFLTGGIFYDIEYIDANNEIKNKRLDASALHVYLSNESKYVINNFGLAFDDLYLNGSD